MEKLSKIIAANISHELNYDDDKKQVIAYGMFAILQTIVAVVSLIVMAVLLNVLSGAINVFLTGSVLRKYSGGVHASSSSKCMVIGNVMCILLAITAKFILFPHINLLMTIIIGMFIFIISFLAVYKLVPVDSKNKPIRTEKKRNRMKRGSNIILMLYLLIVIVNIGMYIIIGNNNFSYYVWNIYSGIVWQIFTLTRVAHLIFRS